MKAWVRLFVTIALVCAVAVPASAYPRPGRTERISVSAEGEQSNHESPHSAISGDGRFVAFSSQASNLVPGDTNGSLDIFVHDRATGGIERASVSNDGVQGDRNSFNRPAISPDGRYVAFQSLATTLVPGPANNSAQIFVRDRVAGTTERVSVSNEGAIGNDVSSQPALSSDGRFVAFQSRASNLVPDDTNSTYDVFVHDRQERTTERVSVSSQGVQANGGIFDSVDISADGRYVVFGSSASNLVPGDTNGADDVFLHDRERGTTELVSVTDDGMRGNGHSYSPSISADGRYVAFISHADNLVPSDTNFVHDIFVRDRLEETTERVSLTHAGANGNAQSYYPSISADGRYVAFASQAANLVPDDTNSRADIFVRDRETDTTERVSVAGDATQSDGNSGAPSISGDGRAVSFSSFGATLVPGDTNNRNDIFVRERGPAVGVGDLTAVSGGDGASVSGWAAFSGRIVSAALDEGEPLPVTSLAGVDIAEASLLYRPENEDLLVRLRLAGLPSHEAWAAPWAHYGFRFRVGGTRFEARSISGLTGSSLFRCDPECVEQGRLSGGVGTAGPSILVSVPMTEIGAGEGDALTDLQAYTALGPPQIGAPATMDELDLPDAVIPRAEVMLGVAPGDVPEDEVTLRTTAALAGGIFSGSLELGAGEQIWARACLGEVCGAASISFPG